MEHAVRTRSETQNMIPVPTLQPGSLDEVASEIDSYQLHFEEIKRSNPDWIYVDSSPRKVFRMHNYVVKFGPEVDSREAQTLQFIKKSTTIPVPDALISDQPNAIVMDYVEGCNLQDCWTRLSSEERQGIAKQMCDIIQQLRGLQGNYIGAVNRGPAVDMRRSTYTGGPFDSEKEFNEFLLSNMTSSTPSLYRSAIQQKLRRDHKLVFSHADLNLRNIIVRDGVIVALLDWEYAGWYPEYWEFVKFCAASCHDREWHNLGPTIFSTTYPDDLINDQYLALFLF